MSGRVGDLSAKQEQLLNEFKIILEDVLEPKHDDHLLLQFLRARCFDLKKSEDMFRKHLQWRERYPKEYMLTGYKCSEVLKNHYVGPFLGFDREGSPVRLIRVGTVDISGVLQSCRWPELEEYIVWCLDIDMQRTKEHNEKLGRHVETRTAIFDLETFSFRQATKSLIELLVMYLKMYEANFPENLKVAYILNIPYFFAFIFNVAKTILSASTVQKLKIFGRDGYQEELIAIMDPEILPASLGGTRIDEKGDPKCQALFGIPGTVPSYFYLKNKRRLSDENGVRELTVGRMSKQEVYIYAETLNSILSWQIEVPQQDLIYGIFYKKEVGDNTILEEIVPFQKAGGIHGTASGSYVIKKLGKYVFIFDNKYSFIRSKKVFYRFKLREHSVSTDTTTETISY